MANTNNPHGFRPVRSIGGSAGHAKVSYLTLAAANTAVCIGDPVTITSGDVDRAAASAALCGIAAEYKAASSGGLIAVWADPQQLFEAQTDDGTGTCTTAALAMGANADFVATSTAFNTYNSTAEIDETSATTTATLPFKILQLHNHPKNAYGEFNRLVVKINNHQLGSHTGTAGS